MGAEPQPMDRREARAAWCADQPIGANSAAFYPGDEIRCPGRFNHRGREREHGLPCGNFLKLHVRPQTQVIVRVRTLRDPPSATGLDGFCDNCRAKLELFVLRESTG